MACVNSRVSRGLALAGGLACAAALGGLSGCSSTTYGTGVDPGTQTIKDIAGMALMGGGKKPAIDYEPRAGVVPPPSDANASLPAPQSNTAADATAVASAGDANPPNWPNDPDLARAKFKADVAAREARGEPAPKLKLPPGSMPDYHPQMTSTDYHDIGPSKKLSPEEQAAVRKAFADAKGGLALDANGNPVRRYLTDPPSELRKPDTTQPVVFTDKKKKFHWWWQKQDDSLTPVTSADASTEPGSTPPATN